MANTLNNEIWVKLRATVKDEPLIPAWVSKVFVQPADALPKMAANPKPGTRITVAAEYKTVTASYLQFLQQQIDLEPRGADWTQLLERRLEAIQKFKGRKLLFVSIGGLSRTFYARFLPPTFALVHWEVFA